MSTHERTQGASMTSNEHLRTASDTQRLDLGLNPVDSSHALPPCEDYRRVVDNAQEGIWIIDIEGRSTLVNSRMAELIGYSRDEMIGQLHTDFMWPVDRPQGVANMERRRHGRRTVWDQRYRRKDGIELWTVATCYSLSDDDGRVIGACGMFIDIAIERGSKRSYVSISK